MFCMAPDFLKAANCVGPHRQGTFRPGFQCKQCRKQGQRTRHLLTGTRARSGAFSGTLSADRPLAWSTGAPLTVHDVNARRQRIKGIQDEEEGATAARMGRVWSESVKEILVRLFEEKLPLDVESRFALCLVGSLARREACPSSDVDAFLLLQDTTAKIRAQFERAVQEVSVAMTTTFDGGVTGLRFCTGGLTPELLMDTPAALLNQIQADTEANPHVLGVQESTFLYGYEPLHEEFRTLVDAWFSEREAVGGKSVLKRLEELLSETKRARDIPTADDFIAKVPRQAVHIKQHLHRPVQQLAVLLGNLFGVSAQTSRERVEELIRRGHMSYQNGWLLINTLEDVEKMRVALHLAAGTEMDEVWINHPRVGQNLFKFGVVTTENLRELHLGTDKEIATIWACSQRLNHLLALAREFVTEEQRYSREMAARPKGLFARKTVVRPARNPFADASTFSAAARPKKATTG